jgi:hypothetical protein
MKGVVMKPMLILLLLSGISAWGQSCSFSDLVFIPTRCPCTKAIVFVDECQGTSGGQGCSDAAGTNFCGPTCAILTATGCNPRGPKLEVPLLSRSLERDIRAAFSKGPQVAACEYDHEAFKRWLAKTSTSRHVQPLKGVGY